ncbi:M16 family metallopeptidase [Thermophagus xiamenensis]|uniref:Predicted Zn-dependent peptidase n=1 Tax=Thermophagus xiamenensis TaxID=385682 RepID=A0A1I2FAN7_9BACT|nr:pitrilysin family protein [Thermophagus xiamenensis]SFF02285.1 Predicted Zn-dependent peptidase [Thermophagus xiamenensis]
MNLFTHTLSNGIRIVLHRTASPVGHCGLIINTGSRDEQLHEHGMAHFIEHVIFKGTQKRKTWHILSRLEDVGGELNAYTSKEETAIYASFLIQDFERTIELLHDITFHSVFPEKELKKEKEVIIDEINSYKDNPAELIIDDFEELVFNDGPMGRNILGTAESVRSFTREDILRFIRNNYHTDQMVLCMVGDLDSGKFLKTVNKYFGQEAANYRQTSRPPTPAYKPASIRKELDTFQSHITLGNIAYDLENPKRLGLSLLNNLLGGPGLNSRLNMALREKNGIAYNIESIYSPYYRTGVFSIYFGTDRQNIDRSLRIARRELARLRDKKLGQLQLHKARRQLKGQITIAHENKENLMLSIGKSYLLYNKVDSLSELYKKIDKLTASDLLEIANEVFDENQLSYLIYE